MINGKRYSWEDISIRLPHGLAIDITRISYEDSKDLRAVYGKGSMPRGRGAGNYEASGKVTILREEFERLLTYVRSHGGALYKLPPFEVSVSYANEDEPTVTDTLRACCFTKTSTGVDQGAEKVEVELDITIFGGILYNGVPADVDA